MIVLRKAPEVQNIGNKQATPIVATYQYWILYTD
jgi:hypothetical protein